MSESPGTRDALLDLLAGRVRAQAVSTAAALGLADKLHARALDVDELAAACDADPARLERLLVVLEGLGLLTRDATARYALTPLGAELRADALGPLAALLGAPALWDPWSSLRAGLAVDAPTPFARTHGIELYHWLARDDDVARAYDVAIAAYTRPVVEGLVERLDLSATSRLVDLGAGTGETLHALLRRWPALHGVHFDLPRVAQVALERRPPELAERLEVLAGDVHHAIPRDADAYLLQHVLHNCDDARAVALLARCAAALAPGGRVFVVESLLMPDARLDAARLLDLEMLVLTGGRTRRKPELRRLVAAAGLALESAETLTPASAVLCCRRAGAPRAPG